MHVVEQTPQIKVYLQQLRASFVKFIVMDSDSVDTPYPPCLYSVEAVSLQMLLLEQTLNAQDEFSIKPHVSFHDHPTPSVHD